MKAMNVAYNEEEERSIGRRIGIALAFTAGAVGLAVVALGAIVVVPGWLKLAGLGAGARIAGTAGSWVVLLASLVTVLAALYRYGPSRARARWRWITPGAILAVVIAMVASAAFSLYVAKFGSFGETYGSLAAVVVVLLWLWISAFAVVLGAELNSELEHQTHRDTTTGEPRPMGERNAYVADDPGHRP
jgi:membrane protein